MSSTKSVVISCAGIGSRLGLGKTKALLEFGGKSIIRRQIELFNDIEDLRIVVGYQANDIVEEVLNVRQDVIFIYNHDYFNTKTGASLALGAEGANDYVIAWDGDLLVHPEDVKLILEQNGEFVCFSDVSSEEAVFVAIDNDGNITSFSSENGLFEWTGPACLHKSKWTFTLGNVFEQITPHLPLRGLKIRAFDIDTYDDYKRMDKILKSWK